jgi:hypothetical protein
MVDLAASFAADLQLGVAAGEQLFEQQAGGWIVDRVAIVNPLHGVLMHVVLPKGP